MNKFEEYAHLLIEVGLNIQKGQELVINSPVACADFTRLCVKAAYEVGAKDVTVLWRDDFVTRQHWLNAADEVFDSVPEWLVDRNLTFAKNGTAWLSISATDPENLKGVDPERLSRFERTDGEAQGKFYDMMMNSEFPWCVASIPVASWSRKVFKDVPEQEATDRLWNAIFEAVRIKGDGKAVDAWRKHCSFLKEQCNKLNRYNFKCLKYSNSIGTDLTVELPEDHVWAGGAELSKKGIEFVANMPTEEVFTAPKRNGVNGKIVASRPLVISGNIVENFYFILKDGVIVEVHAEKGEDVLRNAISVDTGASMLGEVALVPFNSPISNSGILFYNTLFDENASCHFAFGDAYPCCIKGGDMMSKEQLIAKGLNDSKTHCDFMVGTADLSIVGVTHDGKEIKVFENGNFAI